MSLEERSERLARRLKPLLEEDSGVAFRTAFMQEPEKYSFLTRSFLEWERDKVDSKFPVYDEWKYLKEGLLGIMFTTADLTDYYGWEGEIDWDKDWIDKTPIYIDYIKISDHIEIHSSREFDWDFMVKRYYHLYTTLPGIEFSIRPNRIKAARIIPAAIKDIEVFLRLLNESLAKYNVPSSELVWDDIRVPTGIRFSIFLSFPISETSDEEVIMATMRRIRALVEYRRRFRAWLPSEERRSFYESTRRFPPHTTLLGNMAELCAWPLGIPEKEEKYEEYLKKRIMSCMYYDDVVKNKQGKMEPLHPFYNLDGYSVKLVGDMFFEQKAPGQEPVARARGEVKLVIDKENRLEPMPLNEVEFLREDYPELFSSTGSNQAWPPELPDIKKLIEKALSNDWMSTPKTVPSVTLSKVDLDLIDTLVKTGIFKNRSEGISFFTRKGILASAEWLKRVQEKIDEIKKLQEEARRRTEVNKNQRNQDL
ncbi:MAG: hypothetical protein QW482_02640 [Thermoproteota archaeon]